MNDLPDFDAVYRGTPLTEAVTEVPWNIGEPQPAIAALLDDGDVESPVLDAGCGVGVTVIALAARGHEVVGLDAAATAIERARHDAAAAGVRAELDVADLTALTGHDGRFGTIIDSALFHSLDADHRPDYVAGLARAARPGARLHVLVFTHDAPLPSGAAANGVTPDQLRDLVSTHWTVDRIVGSSITVRFPAGVAPGAPRDDRGRAVLPAWLLRAHLPG